MTAYADHMTIAEIIHDFATRQGDLTDRGVRDDLAAILERRIAAEKAEALDEASLVLSEYAAQEFDLNGPKWSRGAAIWDCASHIHDLAEQIRTTETEGTK